VDFRYKIPNHLQGYLGDMQEDKLTQIMTVMFEMAINHRMLDYPKLHIERQVDDISSALVQLVRQTELSNRRLTEQVNVLSKQIVDLGRVYAPRSELEDLSRQYEEETEDVDNYDDMERQGDAQSDDRDEEFFDELIK